MNAPARIGSIVGMALLCSLACRGDLVVNWLDEPLWLNADPPPIIGQPDRHDIDLDGNGTIDFSFSGIWHISVDFRSENSNRYLIVPDPPPNTGGAVAALEAGFMIGAESGDGSLDWFGDDYDYWSTLMLNLDTGEAGEFWGQRAYIGVEFQRDDGVHYGWFDVEGGASGPYAVIRGWAYERQAKKPIHAGELPSVANSFDGDHKSDLCLYYPPEGLWHFSLSSGGVLTKHFGFAGANPITGDFDGDGKDDYGCYDAEGHYGQPPGSWYFMQSTEGFVTRQFGYAGTVPVTGDFDGDGKDDYGCYDAEGHYGQPAGSWYLMQSKDGFRTEEFGYAGTVPVVGDFDGDGTDDYGCYDAIGRYGQSPGSWYFMTSANGFYRKTFGYSGTVPVVGDFDGDGSDDYAVYDADGHYGQPAGFWYFMTSSDGFFTKTFGYAGTVPVVGDFDGDGISDYGCYDAVGRFGQSSGSWYIMQSADGFKTETFGYEGTIPLGSTITTP